MPDVAATPSGGAEVSARPDASAQPQASIKDRLKASLFPPTEGKPTPGEVETPPQKQIAQPVAVETPQAKPDAVDEPAEDVEKTVTEDVQTEEAEAKYESLSDLAEALGWDLDKILDLEASTKIDGKEGKARLRDLLKSHQLEGHLNQKLMTFADEKKAFETERQTQLQQHQHKLMQLDAGLQVAQKLLEGEFSGVNWQDLQNTDPLSFNQQYVAFQQRQAQLNHIAGMLGQERQTAQQQAEAQTHTYLAEQSKLMESKIPEWADSKVREKEIADMSVLMHQTYGVTEAELKGLKDHREILIARDACKWQKLQQTKPATLNKVKTAPKLLKPGTTQSRAEQSVFALKGQKDKLRQTGKVSEAVPLLKSILYPKH